MVVLVQPARKGVAPRDFGWVEPSKSPAGGQGAVDAFELALRLRSGGPGAFWGYPEFCAGVAPEEAAICAAVVGQHPGGRDAASGRQATARRRTAFEVAPAAAVGNVAELLHIDMQQVTRLEKFVAADRFAGGPVDTQEPVDPAADQHRAHG